MGHSSPDVNTGPQNKDKSLNHRSEDSYGHEWKGKKKRNDGSDDEEEKLFSEYVTEESDGKRDRTGEMTDDFNRQQKRG